MPKLFVKIIETFFEILIALGLYSIDGLIQHAKTRQAYKK
jgi:hypothetical protein